MSIEVTAGSEEGFADLQFVLTRIDRAGGRTTIQAQGVHQGEPVGFICNWGGDWTEQPLENGYPIYWGKVELVSSGPESDALVRVLDEVYETQTGCSTMKERVEFKTASLGGDPAGLDERPLKMKLFFESDEEQRYAEFYLNVDLAAARVEIREKDCDFRQAVVGSLSGDLDCLPADEAL